MSQAVAFVHAREAPETIHRSTPEAQPGEVRVRIEACGLGAADFGFFQLDALPRTPLVPGLEAVGIVETSENQRLPVGAKVGLTPLAEWCGGCDVCERGLERFCGNARLHGWHRDGFLAEQVTTTERALVRLDAEVDSVSWAPLFATGWTAMSAVRASGIGAGLRLGIFGVGGLGHLVVQVGRALGLEVVGFDFDAARRTTERSSAPVDSLDAAVVCTPSPQAIAQAVRAVRRGGRVVLAGASPSVRLDLSLFDTVMRGISLVPSFLGTRSELDELIDLARAGKVRPVTHRLTLADVPKRFWMLRDGGFDGRLVVTPGG